MKLNIPNWQKTLYILFTAQLVIAVGFSSIFPFFPLYVESLGSSTGLSIELLSGLVFSSQAFSMMLAAPIWGVLADRFGRKLMVERSMFGGALLLLMMAFVRSAEELVLLRMVQGLVTGTVAAASALVAATAPRERSGYAMGLLRVGLGIGIALGPMLGGVLADAYGYRSAFFVTAALLFFGGVLVLFGVNEVFVPAKEIEAAPGFWKGWSQVFATPGISTIYITRFLSELGRVMLVPVAPLFIKTILPGDAQVNTFTGLVVGAAAATTTLSALYLGRLSDRIGQRQIIIASLLSASLIYFPQSLVQYGWQLLALQALAGVALGGVIPIISALLATHTQHGKEGAAYGLESAVHAGARMVAPMVGVGIASLFSLRATFIASALIFLFTWSLTRWRLPERKPSLQPVET